MVKTREFSESERLKMFEMRVMDKMSLGNIATKMGASKSGVQGVINKMKTFGSARNLFRSGRSRCTSMRTDNQIKRTVNNNRKLKAHEVLDELPIETRNISLQTIRNRLKEKNFYNGFATNKPMISKINRRKRLSFAKQYLSMDISFWKKVLWSDESKFEIMSSRRIRCWKVKGEGLIPATTNPTVKHSKSAMVWGCVSWSGVGRLAEVSTTMDAKLYVQILNSNLFQSAEDLKIRNDFIFQADNDPKHTSKLAKKWLSDNDVVQLTWPPQSPDLSIIENLWNYLDLKLEKSDRKSFHSFKTALFAKWKNIPQELIENLIKGIPKRLEDVIKAKGGPTSH